MKMNIISGLEHTVRVLYYFNKLKEKILIQFSLNITITAHLHLDL